MSELQTRFIDDTYVEYYNTGKHELAQIYLKSEADKVIAELKAQKAQAEDDCAYWKMNEGNAVNAMHETEEYAMQLYKEAQHHKYKRCLAMVEMLEHICPRTIRKAKWKGKWYMRWLELAEKFKEAKNG